MTWIPPTYQQFQDFFNRDFPYAPVNTPVTDLNYVQPGDINKAISEALINFSAGMFDANGKSTIVFMYLAAFYLVENLKASIKGIGAQASFPLTSLAAGGVNVSMQPPEQFLKRPTLSMFARNSYGMQYLSFVYPYTIGNMRTAFGTTSYT